VKFSLHSSSMAIFNDNANVNNNSSKDKSADKSAKKGDKEEQPEGGCGCSCGCRDLGILPTQVPPHDPTKECCNKPARGNDEDYTGGHPGEVPEGYDQEANYAFDKSQMHGTITVHYNAKPCDRYFHGITKGKEGCGCSRPDNYQHDYSLRVAGPCDRHQIKPNTCGH